MDYQQDHDGEPMERKLSPAQQSRITFYGEDIIAALQLDPNETFVPIGELCDRLGLERAAEERRVRAHAGLAAGVRKLPVDRENGAERMLCLRIDLLPLWLATLNSSRVREDIRLKLELYQRECASTLWQSFRPQGFGVEDTLLPQRHQQTAAEQAYVAELAVATLARHQMLIERQLSNRNADNDEQGADPWARAATAVDDSQAALLAQTARRVAQTAAERSRRNEYPGIYSGLYRQFSVSSYRRMPPARLREALEWLERWHGDMLGQPEPPPDI
jgi:hypothetical protein